MPVDNALYDRLSWTWWEEDGFLNVLKTGLNPARFGYLHRVLLASDHQLAGLRVLDVGCGGGLLAEEFARLGCQVTGVDPSAESLATARAHAASEGLSIDYRLGSGEALPFPDGSFEVIYCCDVLEHVDDVGQGIAEIARVLRPRGTFLYDTINRTWQSKLIMLKLSQEWPATAWAEQGLHDHAMFITPSELEAHIWSAGLEVAERIGFAPANPLIALKAMWDRAHGRITYAQMGERLGVRESRDISVSYGGWAYKPPE